MKVSAGERAVNSPLWGGVTIAVSPNSPRYPEPGRILVVRVYALTSSQSPRETLDLFITWDAAESELREILEDEPDWTDVLRVVPTELDEKQLSDN